MQVSGVEVAQQTTGEKATGQAQPAPEGIFAAFLKGAIGQSYSPLRLESGTGIGRQIGAEDPSKSTNDYLDTNAPDDSTQRINSEDSDANAASDQDRGTGNEANRDESESAAGASDTPVGESDLADAFGADSSTQTAQIALASATTKQSGTGNGNSATAQQTILPANIAAAQNVPGERALNARNDASKDSSSGPNRLTAQVSETPQQLVSRPTTTLAASVAVAAQAERQRADGPGTANASDRSSENSGNLLLNDSASKTDRDRNALRQGLQSAANAAQPKSSDGAQTAPSQSAAFDALLAQNRPAALGAAASRTAPTFARTPEILPLGSAGGLTTAPGSSANISRPVPIPTQPQIPPRALTGQIAVQIQKSVAQGLDQIKIHLKPAELGRVEIKLDVMQDGRVAAIIVADRPETLEMLQRDTRGLQQALQDAGLKSDTANLSFNLGGGNASTEQQTAEKDGSGGDQPVEDAELVADAETEAPRRRDGDGVIDVEV